MTSTSLVSRYFICKPGYVTKYCFTIIGHVFDKRGKPGSDILSALMLSLSYALGAINDQTDNGIIVCRV